MSHSLLIRVRVSQFAFLLLVFFCLWLPAAPASAAVLGVVQPVPPSATYSGWAYLQGNGSAQITAWRWASTGWTQTSFASGTPVWAAPWGAGWTWIWANSAWHAASTSQLGVWTCTAATSQPLQVTTATSLRRANSSYSAAIVQLTAGESMTRSCANDFADAGGSGINFALVNGAHGSGYVDTSLLANTITTAGPAVATAGLTMPFALPDAPTGRTLDIRSYGATPNDTSNDDGVGIRAAISAARSGDTVYIPNGRYMITTRNISLKSGVNITGESQAGAVLDAHFTTLTNNPTSQLLNIPAGTSNLTVSAISITSTGGQSLQVPIRMGSGQWNTDNATATQVSRIAVRHVTIENYERFGIDIENGVHVLVDSATIRNATAQGVGGEGYGINIGMDRSHDNWITGSTVGPNIRHGYLIEYRAHNNLVEHNVAAYTSNDAFDLHGEDEYSNELRYNVVHDCATSGFGVGEYSPSTVPGATPASHDNTGPDNYIHDNEVYRCREGLRITNHSNHTRVENNNFHNDTYGIKADLMGLSDLTVVNNRLTANGTGAYFDNVVRLIMRGNTSTGNTGSGLATNAGTTNYQVTGNDFRSNGAAVRLGSMQGTFSANSQ